MPSTYETPLIPPDGSLSRSPYETPRHEYRAGRLAYRWTRTLFFVSLLILNNLAWTYIYTRSGLDSGSHFVQPSEPRDEVTLPVFSSHGPKPHSHPVHPVVPPQPETIQIVMVMIGSESAKEGAMVIKSAIMYTSRPIAFHLLCDEDAIPIIESKLRLFSRPTYSVDVAFYPVSTDAIKARSGRAGIGTQSVWGMLLKVFMHELLLDVEKAIFVDTDMLFVLDPLLLWNTFSTLKPNQLMAFPTLGPNSDASQICTCVMLLNLTAMRNTDSPFISSTLVSGWSKNALSSKAFELTYAAGGVVLDGGGSRRVKFDPMNPLYGDQGLYHIIWTHFPELFVHLSLRWDTTHCRSSYGLQLGRWQDAGGEDVSETEQIKAQFYTEQAPENYEQLLPGILHFNCQDRLVVWEFAENYEKNTWAPMITMITRYKWIWLNRGDGSASVKIRTEKDVRFLDQRIADGEQRAAMASEEGTAFRARGKRARLDSANS